MHPPGANQASRPKPGYQVPPPPRTCRATDDSSHLITLSIMSPGTASLHTVTLLGDYSASYSTEKDYSEKIKKKSPSLFVVSADTSEELRKWREEGWGEEERVYITLMKDNGLLQGLMALECALFPE